MTVTLNQFVDRDCPGQMITQGGFTSHAQAGARVDGSSVLFLLLQGRQTHVRAHWASFHERELNGYQRLPGKETYLKPNPTAVLPSGAGIEMAIVHRGLIPGQNEEAAGHLFTFGPPHFGLTFQAAMPVPMLAHWEPALWHLGLKAGLIRQVPDTWNVRLWLVQVDTEHWLRAMAARHELFTYEP